MSKLSFFEWIAEQHRHNGEAPSTTWIENYAKKTAWESYQNKQPMHDGDCVNRPYSCDLCILEDLLREYREYALGVEVEDENNKN